jgi:hypothetical protein
LGSWTTWERRPWRRVSSSTTASFHPAGIKANIEIRDTEWFANVQDRDRRRECLRNHTIRSRQLSTTHLSTTFHAQGIDFGYLRFQVVRLEWREQLFVFRHDHRARGAFNFSSVRQFFYSVKMTTKLITFSHTRLHKETM